MFSVYCPHSLTVSSMPGIEGEGREEEGEKKWKGRREDEEKKE